MLLNYIGVFIFCCTCSLGNNANSQDLGTKWRVSNDDGDYHLDYVAEASDAYGSFRFSCKGSSGIVNTSAQLPDADAKSLFASLAKSLNPYQVAFNKSKEMTDIDTISYDEFFGWKLHFAVSSTAPELQTFAKSGHIDLVFDNIKIENTYIEGKKSIEEFLGKCAKRGQ